MLLLRPGLPPRHGRDDVLIGDTIEARTGYGK